MHNKIILRKIVLSAMFLAIGCVLPFLTGQIKEVGDTLLPMHIPVLLSGFICGGEYGLIVGLILPFLRSALFSMPPIYPNAIWMAAELMTYGAVAGFIYQLFKKKDIFAIYISLVSAQISGRILWAIAKLVLLNISGNSFTLKAFLIGGFIDALPGILLQLILIPLIISILNKQHIKFDT